MNSIRQYDRKHFFAYWSHTSSTHFSFFSSLDCMTLCPLLMKSPLFSYLIFHTPWISMFNLSISWLIFSSWPHGYDVLTSQVPITVFFMSRAANGCRLGDTCCPCLPLPGEGLVPRDLTYFTSSSLLFFMRSRDLSREGQWSGFPFLSPQWFYWDISSS